MFLYKIQMKNIPQLAPNKSKKTTDFLLVNNFENKSYIYIIDWKTG